MTEGHETRSIDVLRVRGGVRTPASDRVAIEEPLEIRLHGRAFAVIMRTPGCDRELAAGFLHAERVIRSADDLGTIEYCTDRDPQRVALQEEEARVALRQADSAVARPLKGRDVAENVINVTLTDGSAERLERLLADRRQVTMNSSCGLCGRQTIESLLTSTEPLREAWTIAAADVAGMPDRLRARQASFDETGGLHAAGLFTIEGALVDTAEDVGRHNAVDKIIGRMLMRDALPLGEHVLCVSGRTSYEIVQKAIFAGIPLVAAVSAPSSLAIELARDAGVTLIGFSRGDSFNIYTHEARIER